jgi:hypothetical protein
LDLNGTSRWNRGFPLVAKEQRAVATELLAPPEPPMGSNDSIPPYISESGSPAAIGLNRKLIPHN